MLGGPGVGKSALTMRLVKGMFVEEYDPSVENKYEKKVLVDGKYAILSKPLYIFIAIIDTAGNDDFNALVEGWIGEGNAFLLVFHT